MKTISQLVNGINRTVGAIRFDALTSGMLVTMFNTPEFQYNKQRDHLARMDKKRYLHGELTGDSQLFYAVYIKETKAFKLIDGYTRAALIDAGRSFFKKGINPRLITHTAATVKDADALYKQYNSAVASKRSSCDYEGGLRALGILDTGLLSNYLKPYGMATAVKQATGFSNVTDATIELGDALLLLDSYKLSKSQHEIVGVKGTYLAVAHYCSDLTLVEDFIKNANNASFDPIKPTKYDEVIKEYRNYLLNQDSIGGAANTRAFIAGLRAFIQYASLRLKKRVSRLELINLSSLGQFKQALNKLGLED